MAPSKKIKKIHAHTLPPERKRVIAQENPESIYQEHPSWSFSAFDSGGRWSFTKERLHDSFWDTILPKLAHFESMTWRDILMDGKKQHHSISVSQLNKVARDRLMELQLTPDKLVGLRLNGTWRIYGFFSYSTFVILWVDDNHGNNDTCVCRSSLKHT